MNILRKYNTFLNRRPLFSRCITAAVLVWAGDVIAQRAIYKHKFWFEISKGDNSKAFDWQRSGKAFIMGYTVIALNMYGWYNKIIPAFLKKFANVSLVSRYPIATITVLGKIE